MLAAIRPDSWNYALFLHVLGAAVLVGALVTAGTALVLSWRENRDAAFTRFAFRTLLFVAVPAWFVMRIGAEWIYSKEHWADVPNEPDWLGVGYLTADLGGLLLLISVVLAGVGARRLARPDGGSTILARSAGALALLVLALYLVALWAMTAKPG
jgi:putative copper export protein